MVELLVVMVLLGVVGGITVQGIVTALQSSTRTQARIAATHETEIAVQRVSRDLRAAAPFEIEADTDPRFELTTFVSYGGEAYKVTYRLVDMEDDTQQLQQVSVRVDEDDAEVGAREAVLMTLVNNRRSIDDVPAGEEATVGDDEEVVLELEPIFNYFGTDGELVTCPPTDCLSDYLGAAQIGISLRRAVIDQDPVTVETRTAVRSIRYRSALS